VRSLGRITVWVFPAWGALGGGFSQGHCDLVTQKSVVCNFPYHSNAQSPNWPACKELQISEFSAREGSLFYFCELPQAVKWNHQFPIPAPLNFSAHYKFKWNVLRSQMPCPLALSWWQLATAFWCMRNAELSCCAAVLLHRRKLLSCDIPTLGLRFVDGINIFQS
jgi:hypothetical protein